MRYHVFLILYIIVGSLLIKDLLVVYVAVLYSVSSNVN
jgi:hypothetical protein